MSQPSPRPDESPDDRSVAETFLLPTPNDSDKQDRDVALAAELLRSGMLSDRQLSAALGGWSVHGAMPLGDHLRKHSELTEEQIAQLEATASARVSRSVAKLSDQTSGSDSLVETLEKLDDTGRVARLFGVSAVSGVTEKTARQSDARYQLMRKLGQGGLGRVWLARDENMQRLVALKEVTNAGQASEVTLARFRHEAEITGRLEHPGIVPVYQLGEDVETGFAFYTMRFLGKETLQDSIAEYHERREAGDHDPMLLRRLLTAFVNICNAIGHAHSRKVIHRDLKPENVVIDNFGQVIVIDWGLAKVLDEAAVEQLGPASLSGGGSGGTLEGQVLGTPLYMAPEQAGGRLDEIDERTDIYGLGGILFSVITGYAPHERTQSEQIKSGGGPRALISAIVGGATPRAKDANPEVDPALAAIAAKAMAQRRYARYQTAAELGEEVQRWMADEPVSAYEEPPLKQLQRWVRRHPRVSQAIALLLALALAAGATLAVSSRQNQLSEEQARFEQMRADAREVEVKLRGASADLASSVRFMSMMPPVQGIIRAQAGVEGDDDLVWRGRLEKISEELLRAKPDYLAVAYVAAHQGGAQELTRVERNASDPTLLRTLPASRRQFFESDPFLETVLQLEPGDTRISVDPRPRQSAANARTKRLTIAVPVFAEVTGEPFGMLAIETHLGGKIPEILEGLGALEGEVYISDGDGNIWGAADPESGVADSTLGWTIAKIAPEVLPLVEGGIEGESTDGESYYAKRFLIDPSGKGAIVLVKQP